MSGVLNNCPRNHVNLIGMGVVVDECAVEPKPLGLDIDLFAPNHKLLRLTFGWRRFTVFLIVLVSPNPHPQGSASAGNTFNSNIREELRSNPRHRRGYWRNQAED